MDERARRVRKETDYINIKRYSFSLKEMLKVHPAGCPLALQARALMLDEDEVAKMMAKIVAKIRRAILTKSEMARIETRLKMELIENIRNYLGMVQSRQTTPEEKRMIKAGELFLKTLSRDDAEIKEQKSDD